MRVTFHQSIGVWFVPFLFGENLFEILRPILSRWQARNALAVDGLQLGLEALADHGRRIQGICRALGMVRSRCKVALRSGHGGSPRQKGIAAARSDVCTVSHTGIRLVVVAENEVGREFCSGVTYAYITHIVPMNGYSNRPDAEVRFGRYGMEAPPAVAPVLGRFEQISYVIGIRMR